MRLAIQMTENVEIGAMRVLNQDALEVVTQDSGHEVRNLRSSDEPRQWQVALPVVDIDQDTTDYDSVRQMWLDTLRGLYAFDFYDFVDGTVYPVRFASPLQITAPAGHLRHVDTFTLKETLETTPQLTAGPAITGTLTVGSTLTMGSSWAGSVTKAWVWTRDGEVIPGATAGTYLLVSDDLGATIGGYVTATDAYGNATRAYPVSRGPVA